MLKLLLILSAVITLARCQSTSVAQCTVHSGDLPTNTYVEGCLQPPCHLPQLQDVVVHMVFRARKCSYYRFDPRCKVHPSPCAVAGPMCKRSWCEARTMRDMRTLATAFLSVGPITVPTPYPLGENAHTCNFLTNSFCPVLKGEVLMYTMSMHIESFFPVNTIATLEFRIVDENNAPVVCIRLGIHITEPVGGARNATILSIEN